MKLNTLRPMLWVDNVRATIDWYVQELGFSEGNYREELQWGLVEKDGVSIMLAKPNEQTPFNGPSFTGSLYITTDAVDAWWQQLQNTAPVYYRLETFEWGMREFAIKDCNGYILQFGQDIL